LLLGDDTFRQSSRLTKYRYDRTITAVEFGGAEISAEL
jgi:hypothetical protein